MKNCNAWASYEEPNESPSAALCHGGIYNNQTYNQCPSIYECRRATLAAAASVPDNKIRLNTMPGRPVSSGSTVIASSGGVGNTAAIKPRVEPRLPYEYTYSGYRPANVPTTTPTKTPPLTAPVQTGGPPAPVPITPPATNPPTMQTPFAPPPAVTGISPVFIPVEGESTFFRFLKNAMQGALASSGFHLFGLAQTIDFFPHERRPEKKSG